MFIGYSLIAVCKQHQPINLKRPQMNEVKQKDNFWLYVVGGVILFIGVVFMIKGSEHDKYTKAKQLVAEDINNSAYAIKK
jgi:hypothetical protein